MLGDFLNLIGFLKNKRRIVAIVVTGFLVSALIFVGAPQRALRHFPQLDAIIRIGIVSIMKGGEGTISLIVGDSRVEQWTDRCLNPGVINQGQAINLGRSGTTAKFWADLIRRYANFLPEIENVVIWAGFNDLFHYATPPHAVLMALKDIFEEVLPHAKRLVVVGQIPVAVSPPQRNHVLNEEIQKLEWTLDGSFGRDKRVIYITLYPHFALDLAEDGTLYRDGIHLSQAGDLYVCDLINTALADQR